MNIHIEVPLTTGYFILAASRLLQDIEVTLASCEDPH